MAYKARVYLRRAGGSTRYHYSGEIDLDRRPVEKGQIRFTHRGKTHLGSIEIVSSLKWEKRGVIPMLHVVLSPYE
jgi:hypothetical protein